MVKRTRVVGDEVEERQARTQPGKSMVSENMDFILIANRRHWRTLCKGNDLSPQGKDMIYVLRSFGVLSGEWAVSAMCGIPEMS